MGFADSRILISRVFPFLFKVRSDTCYYKNALPGNNNRHLIIIMTNPILHPLLWSRMLCSVIFAPRHCWLERISVYIFTNNSFNMHKRLGKYTFDSLTTGLVQLWKCCIGIYSVSGQSGQQKQFGCRLFSTLTWLKIAWLYNTVWSDWFRFCFLNNTIMPHHNSQSHWLDKILMCHD